MLVLAERRVENVYLYVLPNRSIRVTELLSFDFSDKKYKLVSFNIERIPHLKGGENNE